MYLKKITKSSFLLISLLSITNPTHLQTTQSSPPLTKHTKLVIPTVILSFLSKQLNKLPNATERTSLFEALDKFQNNPNILTQKEKQQFSEYVNEQTMQLNKEVSSIKGNKERKQMEQVYQTLSSFKEEIRTQYNTAFTETNNTQQPATLRRPHELLIPANGQCLYTSIILGYLLPVVESPNEFNQRVQGIVEGHNLPITHNELTKYYQDLEYLDTDTGFQQIISSLLNQIGTQPGTWGGPKEVRLIAEKLNVNIQEHTPSPDNPNQLITGTLHKLNDSTSQATIHIVQDIPLPEELIDNDDDAQFKQAQISSLQTSQHRHHYRLYYIGNLPQVLEEEEKYDDESVTDEEVNEVVGQEDKLSIDNVDRSLYYHELGMEYESEAKYEEAAKCYMKSIVLQENKLKKYYLDTSNTYDEFEFLYKEKGNSEEAKKYLKRALTIRSTQLQEYYVNIASCYHALGFVYERQGKYQQAANAYYVLSRLYKNHLNCKKAEKHYVKGLSVREDKLDKDNRDTVKSCDKEDRQCEKQGSYKEASIVREQ